MSNSTRAAQSLTRDAMRTSAFSSISSALAMNEYLGERRFSRYAMPPPDASLTTMYDVLAGWPHNAPKALTQFELRYRRFLTLARSNIEQRPIPADSPSLAKETIPLIHSVLVPPAVVFLSSTRGFDVLSLFPRVPFSIKTKEGMHSFARLINTTDDLAITILA